MKSNKAPKKKLKTLKIAKPKNIAEDTKRK